MAGAGDREVLAPVAAERRIWVTFDRDFGALVFRHVVSAPMKRTGEEWRL
jgi:hypothetical protein